MITLEKVVLEFVTDEKGFNQGLSSVLSNLGKAKRSAVDASGGVGVFEKSWMRMASAVGAGNLLSRAATGLFDFGLAAVESAGSIVDLSDATGLSIEAVQVYGAVARQTGGDINTYANAIFKLGVNLSKGGAEVEGALKRLGLNYAELRKMKPEEQFEAIAEKLKAVSNEGDRNRDGVALLGRTWQDVAPGVKAGIEDIRSTTFTASEANVRAVDDMTDAWDRFLENAKNKTTSFLGTVVTALQNRPDLWSQVFNPAMFSAGLASVIGAGGGSVSTKPPKDGSGKPGRNAADDARDAAHAKRMADEAERYTKAIAELADELSGNKAADEMSKLADAIVTANQAGGVMASKIPKLVEQIKAWKEEGLLLQPILQDILDEDTRNATRAAVEYQAILEDVLDVARGLEAVGPEIGYFFGGHGAPSFGREVPQIDLGFDDDAAEAEDNLGGYVRLLSDATNMMDRLARSSDAGWTDMAQMILGVSGTLANYITLINRATNDEERRAARTQFSMDAISGALSMVTDAINEQADAAEQIMRFAQSTEEAFAELGYTMQEVYALQAGLPFDDPRVALYQQLNPAIIERVLDEARARSRVVTDGINDLSAAFQRFGGVAPASMRPAILSMLDLHHFTAEQREMLEGLVEEAPWETYAEAADRYGMSIDSLGGRFNQLRLNDVFDQLFVDWTMFTDIGADMDQVFGHMSGQVNEALQRAHRLGLAVPEYMRPMLEAMLEAGQLIDENGQVLSDLSGFKFEASIQSSLEITNNILQRILDTLTGQGKKPGDIAGSAGDRSGAANAFGVGADKLVESARAFAATADQRTHRFDATPAPSTASVPAIVQYSGNVSLNIAGRRVADVLIDDLLKVFEQNDGQGRPVGPTSRLNVALGRAA